MIFEDSEHLQGCVCRLGLCLFLSQYLAISSFTRRVKQQGDQERKIPPTNVNLLHLCIPLLGDLKPHSRNTENMILVGFLS